MLKIVDFLQLLLVVPGAALLYAALYWLGRYSKWLKQHRQATGTEWADVRIIQMEPTGILWNGRPVVRLKLMVMPVNGKAFLTITNVIQKEHQLKAISDGVVLSLEYQEQDGYAKAVIRSGYWQRAMN
jgi:hypothetical protein